ncbi:hypothetical protein FCM35_KLT05047 [Carex littledalei]|uniref:Uncharacterized protein n=1 Tax=Carex littledalei TaxID=544730 RepID=A0A833QY54_9POAL|nr:hypothetical protein FCM35_KLT05047 [Carex littledalei]
MDHEGDAPGTHPDPFLEFDEEDMMAWGGPESKQHHQTHMRGGYQFLPGGSAPVEGDVLVIVGSTLYAICNVSEVTSSVDPTPPPSQPASPTTPRAVGITFPLAALLGYDFHHHQPFPSGGEGAFNVVVSIIRPTGAVTHANVESASVMAT